MPQIKEVTVSYGMTVSLGPNSYEFERFDVGVTAAIGPDENEDEVIENIYAWLKEKCQAKKVELVAGLPGGRRR